MSRLGECISGIKDYRRCSNAWIYDDNGNIIPDAIYCDLAEYFESLRDYEINVSDRCIAELLDIENHVKYNSVHVFSSYTVGAKTDIDFVATEFATNDGYIVLFELVFAPQLGTSDFKFVCKFDYAGDFYRMDEAIQYKYAVDNKYHIVMNIFSELYDVYNWDSGDPVAYSCYEISVQDLCEKLGCEAQVKENEI